MELTPVPLTGRHLSVIIAVFMISFVLWAALAVAEYG